MWWQPCESLHKRREREKISRNVIENNRGSATYYIMITDRKNVKDSDDPEEKYIGFATSHPAIKTEVYAKRWGIETGYGKIEECRAKTRISDMESRMRCFYYSLVLYNEWIIVRAMLSDGTERQCYDVCTQVPFVSRRDFTGRRIFCAYADTGPEYIRYDRAYV